MIRRVRREEIPVCAQVVRTSFATVAKEIGLNEENCPRHTSFTPDEEFFARFDSGWLMYCMEENGEIVGYFFLMKNQRNEFEINNLLVLPQYRNSGRGEALFMYALDEARKVGERELYISIIEENRRLRKWYEKLGCVHICTKKFEHLPFTTGYMKALL